MSGTLTGTKVKPVVQPITTSSPYRHSWSYVPNFVDYHSPTSRWFKFLVFYYRCMVCMCVMYSKMLGRDDKLPGFAVIQMHRSWKTEKISFLRKMHTDLSLGHSLDDWWLCYVHALSNQRLSKASHLGFNATTGYLKERVMKALQWL